MTYKIPAWAKKIYNNDVECKDKLVMLITNKEWEEMLMNKDEMYDCMISQLIAEHLGWA